MAPLPFGVPLIYIFQELCHLLPPWNREAKKDIVFVGPLPLSQSVVDESNGSAGYENWEQGWSHGKRHWCCTAFGRACESYDRGSGLGSLGAWGSLGAVVLFPRS